MIRTKIIATIGPASSSAAMIRSLIDAGVDVFRLNFSHGTLEEHAHTFEAIRSISAEQSIPTTVMGDLCGPKIRLDSIEDGALELAPGAAIDILAKTVLGNQKGVSTNRPELIQEVLVGHRVLIDDGSVTLRVEAVHADRLSCICETGGILRDRKGVNLPDSDLAVSSLTDDDRRYAAWAFEQGVDYLAVSFVRSADDIRIVRSLGPASDSKTHIVAKIETPQAVANIDEIIDVSHVILVARGDLGVEMDLASVPLIQKEITRKAQAAGKPVIIATQMLQSMVTSLTATRAEVSDVANAILDSADCVMLSAETAVGVDPVGVVNLMTRIAGNTERFLAERGEEARPDQSLTVYRDTMAVVHGASLLVRELKASLVIAWTEYGNVVRLLSKCRLPVPIVALSPDEHVCRRCNMFYGVLPGCTTRHPDPYTMANEVDHWLLERKLVEPGDLVVLIPGSRLDREGATNALLIHLVGRP